MSKHERSGYYKKYGFVRTPIDFEFHLDENDVHDAERIDENVRIIEIKNCHTEFGLETDPKGKRNTITIELGFAAVKLKKADFEEALKRYRRREKMLLKKRLEKK